MPASTEGGWVPGPARPLLVDGAIHVWRVELTTVGKEVCELLCRHERARGERLLGEQHRALWMRSRGVLRALLGRYLGTDPRTLRFAAGPHGKPALLDAGAGATAGDTPSDPSISFNLSHSGSIALYAFTISDAVGIDIEVARRPVDTLAVARRMLGAVEAERLSRLDDGDREREFRRAWVRHEAELKCLGVGIAGQSGAAATGRAWVAELEVGSGAAAALAAATAPRAVCCWDWPTAPEQC
jgi:4'-phosphopantetheinyl transferase